MDNWLYCATCSIRIFKNYLHVTNIVSNTNSQYLKWMTWWLVWFGVPGSGFQWLKVQPFWFPLTALSPSFRQQSCPTSFFWFNNAGAKSAYSSWAAANWQWILQQPLHHKTVFALVSESPNPGVIKRFGLSWLANRALEYESKCGAMGWVVGSLPMSTAVLITWHGAQIHLGDLTPYCI